MSFLKSYLLINLKIKRDIVFAIPLFLFILIIFKFVKILFLLFAGTSPRTPTSFTTEGSACGIGIKEPYILRIRFSKNCIFNSKYSRLIYYQFSFIYDNNVLYCTFISSGILGSSNSFSKYFLGSSFSPANTIVTAL